MKFFNTSEPVFNKSSIKKCLNIQSQSKKGSMLTKIIDESEESDLVEENSTDKKLKSMLNVINLKDFKNCS